MPAESYTAADVELVRRWIAMPSDVVTTDPDETYTQWAARAVLAGLAGAGRLLPDGQDPGLFVIVEHFPDGYRRVRDDDPFTDVSDALGIVADIEDEGDLEGRRYSVHRLGPEIAGQPLSPEGDHG